MSQHARKNTEGYRPNSVTKAFQVIMGNQAAAEQSAETHNTTSFTTVSIQEMTLVGIQPDEPFPGFDKKERYLLDASDKLSAAIDGTLKTENAAKYFVYHGIEACPLLCVIADDLDAVPEGLVQITVPAGQYAVFTYNGLLEDQDDIFTEICDVPFDMDQDGIRFELYGERITVTGTRTCCDLYFPMKRSEP